MLKRIPLIATLGAVLLLTTACGPIAGPTSSPTDASTGSNSAAPSATPTSDPSAGGGTSTPLTAGDCTRAEMQDAIPTIYTVYTDDATTPVTIHYMAFNHDGTTPTETLTTVGPVITIVGYACTDAAQQADWVLTATHTPVGSLGCVLAFGGMLVNNKSDGQEDAGVTVDCTGNPGK